MIDKRFIPDVKSYIEEVVSQYESEMSIFNNESPGFSMDRYYAGLHLRNLRSRLTIILGYCDRHSITGPEYEKCNKLVQSFNQPKRASPS